MRILITTGIFKPEAGGPASYSARLADKLISYGNNVKVITYSDRKMYDLDNSYNFPIIRIVRNNPILNYIKYFWVVLKNLHKYDLIYTLDHSSAGLPVFLATRLIRKKYIIRIGGDFIWEKWLETDDESLPLRDFYDKGIYTRYKKHFNIAQTILNNADFIVFNSDKQKQLFVDYYGLNKEKIITIYNPVPDFQFDIQRTDVNKEIVFFGRFIGMKNVLSIVHAFAEFDNSEFRLLLIGNGPQEDRIRNLVRKLDLEDKVEILPTMYGEDLWRRIINCYYFIQASWTDISPNQVYECLQLKIPVLLTKENYLPLDTSDWLKIDPASVEDIIDKMNYLNDNKNYQDFVEVQQNYNFKHSWDDVLEEHLELFGKLISAYE